MQRKLAKGAEEILIACGGNHVRYETITLVVCRCILRKDIYILKIYASITKKESGRSVRPDGLCYVLIL